ncbi:N-acetylmuramoyl-L-alanine amidase [Acrocarpospora corrugata]|uniref:N-acetylmuramoyl-L-alanine amidase n=1 Tax=Acrocarpospora corrugata TaxID=35763 RepID=A0A5M3W0L2_9ACTN|nr:N-acetylmuramoyl-L-alanine amidase [Acrocarpospora corrugata]GES02326.1 N-acetylmuramoyl-L-alanine amidase [Acrocarpospora corrugata]
MPYLLQLAAVARRTGYPVTEVAGWRTRGHGAMSRVEGLVCHHTAGWDDLHVVRDGRPGLDGPLSQIWLRKDGRIFVVAAGKCWQNAPSTSPHHMNHNSIGIEAENDGKTPWPAAQMDAYRRLCAELAAEFELPASRVRGHKEVNRAKVDPHSISMPTFRAAVAQLLSGEDEPKPETEDDVPVFTRALELASPMMRGDDVRSWQSRARTHVPDLDADSWYGKKSTAACRQVQELLGIPISGVVDEETWLLSHIWEPEAEE